MSHKKRYPTSVGVFSEEVMAGFVTSHPCPWRNLVQSKRLDGVEESVISYVLSRCNFSSMFNLRYYGNKIEV